MNLFVPYDDSDLARVALDEACRVLTPLDRITVMAAVIVPASRAVDAPPGEVWKQTCRAEVHLAHAREYAERVAHFGAGLRCVRVQARTVREAIIAGAAHYAADTIVLAESAGPRGRLAALFGPIRTLLGDAPCDVRVVYKVTRPPRHAARTGAAAARTAPSLPAPAFPRSAGRVASEYPRSHQEGMSPYVSE